MRSNAAGKDAGRSICLEDSCSAGSAEIETGGSGVGITAWLIIPKAPGLFSKASGSWLLVLLWPMMLSYEGAGSSACGRGSGRASGAVGNGGLAIGATGAASGAGARDGASQAAVPPEEGDTFTCFASAASGPAIGKRGFAGNGCGTSTAFAPARGSPAPSRGLLGALDRPVHRACPVLPWPGEASRTQPAPLLRSSPGWCPRDPSHLGSACQPH
eukprot:scaffold2429_cov263-Pinguiococcus_pyrenoidosus.AAC.5